MGLSLVVEEPFRLPQLNAVLVPPGVDDARVKGRLLEEYSLEIFFLAALRAVLGPGRP